MTGCITLHCPNPAVDEYHWFETLHFREKVLTVEVVWELCEECCEFVESVVEDISNIEECIMTLPSCHRCGAVGGAKYGGKDVCPDCFEELKKMEQKS